MARGWVPPLVLLAMLVLLGLATPAQAMEGGFVCVGDGDGGVRLLNPTTVGAAGKEASVYLTPSGGCIWVDDLPLDFQVRA